MRAQEVGEERQDFQHTLKIEPTDLLVGLHVGRKEREEPKHGFNLRSESLERNWGLTCGHIKSEMDSKVSMQSCGGGSLDI